MKETLKQIDENAQKLSQIIKEYNQASNVRKAGKHKVVSDRPLCGLVKINRQSITMFVVDNGRSYTSLYPFCDMDKSFAEKVSELSIDIAASMEEVNIPKLPEEGGRFKDGYISSIDVTQHFFNIIQKIDGEFKVVNM